MDVNSTIYQQRADESGDNGDVGTLVMEPKANRDYTVKVIPDHNPSTAVTTKTDSKVIFWLVAKVLNGENGLFFKVGV